MVEAINQGECTECQRSDENFSVDDRDYHYFDDDEEYENIDMGIRYALVCDCGAESAVAITTEGMFSGGAISHDEASWNDSDE